MHQILRSDRNRLRRGSALSLAIVVSVILSSLIAALAYVAGQTSQATGQITKMDQAFYAAESGAQRVAWYCRNRSLGTLRSPLAGSCNGYNYNVSWPQNTNLSAQVTSTATLGSTIWSRTTRTRSGNAATAGSNWAMPCTMIAPEAPPCTAASASP